MAGEVQRRNEWPLILSLLVAATGLVVLTFYNWRNGVLIFAGSVILAGLLRATLSDPATAFLLATGAAITTLGLIVPN
jgi:hypothetical protein